MAVAHRLLEIIYNVLKKGQSYQELGEDYLDKRQDKERLRQRLLKRLEKLGVKVTVEEGQPWRESRAGGAGPAAVFF